MNGLDKLANGTPGLARSVGVGLAGAVPGAFLGDLAAAGLGQVTKIPADSSAYRLLQSILRMGGGAVGSAAAREFDNQFDSRYWDSKGRKKDVNPREKHHAAPLVRIAENAAGLPVKQAAGDRLTKMRLRRGECPECGKPDQPPFPPCGCKQRKEAAEEHPSWIGFDFDGTLVKTCEGDFDHTKIGEPVGPMLSKLREHLSQGDTCKIFTARASSPDKLGPVRAWLKEYDLPELEITNVKDPNCQRIYDDRAVSVQKDTGKMKEAAASDEHPYGFKCAVCEGKIVGRNKGKQPCFECENGHLCDDGIRVSDGELVVYDEKTHGSLKHGVIHKAEAAAEDPEKIAERKKLRDEWVKRHAALAKTASDADIDDLRTAKAHSDAGRMSAKHALLSKILARSGKDFHVDSPGRPYAGLTHAPSGFRIHAPAHIAVRAAGVPNEKEAQAPWRQLGNLLRIENRLGGGLSTAGKSVLELARSSPALRLGDTPAELKRAIGFRLNFPAADIGESLQASQQKGIDSANVFFARLKGSPGITAPTDLPNRPLFRGLSLHQRPYAETVKDGESLLRAGGYAGGYAHASQSAANALNFSDVWNKLRVVGAYARDPGQVFSRDYGLEKVMASGFKGLGDLKRKLFPGEASGVETAITSLRNKALGLFVHKPRLGSEPVQPAWKFLSDPREMNATANFMREESSTPLRSYNPAYRELGDGISLPPRLARIMKNNLPAFDELMRRRANTRLFSDKWAAVRAAGVPNEKSAIVRKEGDKWVLWTKDLKRRLGTHDSAQDAYKQEYAIQKSQEREKAAGITDCAGPPDLINTRMRAGLLKSAFELSDLLGAFQSHPTDYREDSNGNMVPDFQGPNWHRWNEPSAPAAAAPARDEGIHGMLKGWGNAVTAPSTGAAVAEVLPDVAAYAGGAVMSPLSIPKALDSANHGIQSAVLNAPQWLNKKWDGDNAPDYKPWDYHPAEEAVPPQGTDARRLWDLRQQRLNDDSWWGIPKGMYRSYYGAGDALKQMGQRSHAFTRMGNWTPGGSWTQTGAPAAEPASSWHPDPNKFSLLPEQQAKLDEWKTQNPVPDYSKPFTPPPDYAAMPQMRNIAPPPAPSFVDRARQHWDGMWNKVPNRLGKQSSLLEAATLAGLGKSAGWTEDLTRWALSNGKGLGSSSMLSPFYAKGLDRMLEPGEQAEEWAPEPSKTFGEALRQILPKVPKAYLLGTGTARGTDGLLRQEAYNLGFFPKLFLGAANNWVAPAVAATAGKVLGQGKSWQDLYREYKPNDAQSAEGADTRFTTAWAKNIGNPYDDSHRGSGLLHAALQGVAVPVIDQFDRAGKFLKNF